jgi:hypothetical protein
LVAFSGMRSKPQAWADDVLRGVAKHRQLAPAGSSTGSKNR